MSDAIVRFCVYQEWRWGCQQRTREGCAVVCVLALVLDVALLWSVGRFQYLSA